MKNIDILCSEEREEENYMSLLRKSTATEKEQRRNSI